MKPIKYILLFMLIIAIPLVGAEKLSEKNFSELGYADYTVDKGIDSCENYTITDISKHDNATYILQLKIANYVKLNKNDTIIIKTYLNNKLISEIKNENIKEKNIIELNEFENINEISVCVENKFLPRLVISKYSTVGSYFLPNLKNTDFYQTVPDKVYKNELVPIIVNVKNSGVRDILINITNASKEYLKNSSLENVSGETAYEGILKAGETKSIKYFIKTSNDTNYVTPRAILTYTNEFGEQITLYTKQVGLSITDIKTKLDAEIEISRNIITNQEVYGKIVLRNISEDEIKNITIIPKFDGTIEMYNSEINVLNKKDVIEIPFKINTIISKEYSLSFNLYYSTTQEDNKSVGTQKITITSLPEDNINKQIIAVLVAITVILFIWVVKL